MLNFDKLVASVDAVAMQTNDPFKQNWIYEKSSFFVDKKTLKV